MFVRYFVLSVKKNNIVFGYFMIINRYSLNDVMFFIFWNVDIDVNKIKMMVCIFSNRVLLD